VSETVLTSRWQLAEDAALGALVTMCSHLMIDEAHPVAFAL